MPPALRRLLTIDSLAAFAAENTEGEADRHGPLRLATREDRPPHLPPPGEDTALPRGAMLSVLA